MIFLETILKDAYLVKPEPFTDDRGYFSRMFCKDKFRKIGFQKEFVQFNHSLNTHKHTLRGFHYQVPPFIETKLIGCISGRVLDCIIDIRKNSTTFLKSFSIELSATDPHMVLVPEGFAHGYITLEDKSGMVYFHTAFYKPGFERGLRYNDPALDIQLPVQPEIVSEKDRNLPLIEETQFEGLDI